MAENPLCLNRGKFLVAHSQEICPVGARNLNTSNRTSSQIQTFLCSDFEWFCFQHSEPSMSSTIAILWFRTFENLASKYDSKCPSYWSVFEWSGLFYVNKNGTIFQLNAIQPSAFGTCSEFDHQLFTDFFV